MKTVERGAARSSANQTGKSPAPSCSRVAFVSGPSAGLHAHWHAHDVHAYIMEGETDFLDRESETRIPVRAGDKVVVPARTVHAEGAVKDRVVYLLALPEPLAPDEFLAMHDPDEL
jgi:quercetin dioxygenase-like cupin family protein